MGVVPQKMFSLNGVKSCNSRYKNMKMSYHKARDSKLDPFHNLDKGNTCIIYLWTFTQ